jgi:AraC-like DNA-binding protein/ligand-binding sensor protein
MQHLSIIVDNQVQTYLDYFTDCFGIRIALFDADAQEMQAGKRKGSCEFCAVLRKDAGVNRLCGTLDKKMMKQSELSGKTELYRCHAGMYEAVHALTVDSVTLGYVMVGQIRSAERLPVVITDSAERERLENLYLKQPLYTEEELTPILGLFECLVAYMLQKNYLKLVPDLFLLKLKRFIDAHLYNPVSLPKASEALGMSPSALSHALRRHNLPPFTATMHRRKVELAEELLQRRPEYTIKEIAARLGYSDQYYFSKVFKRFTGDSPSKRRVL